MSATLYLLEVVAYDPDTASTVTLRYASGGGHTTGPAETPANTWYDARLSNPLDIARSLFGGARTQGRARVSAGDIKLQNADGGLDGLLDYAFDGRDVTLRRGTVGAAYPSGFPVAFQGTAESIEIRRTEVILRTRDALFALNQPLQTTTYDGDNVLPDGLEGVAADLKGKPKPFALGVVKNIAPPCVNTAKLIYQVADAAVTSIPEVFDRGISLFGLPVGWSAVVHGLAGDLDMRSAAHDGDNVVAFFGDEVVPENGAVYSTDGGTTFSRVTVAGGSRNALIFADGLFVSPGTPTVTSPTGAAWTTRSNVNPTSADSDIAYSDELDLFVTVGGLSTTGTVSYTSDPTGAWSAGTVTSNFLWGIGWGGVAGAKMFIAVGNGGVIRMSTDGQTFTTVDSPTTQNLFSVRWGGGTWIAVGASGTILTSTNGTQWLVRNSGVTVALLNPTHRNGRWHTCGNFNGFLESTDGGVTWYRPDDTVPSGTYYELIPTDTGWLAFGDNVLSRSHEVVDYADATDLEDDSLAPPPGTYNTYLAGGLIRLGSPPAGLITADITQGATAADRTAAQLWTDVLTKAGYTSADWSTSDVTALDVANDAECGLWIGPSETPTIAEVLDRIARSVGAAWYCDADGLFRIVQVTAPSGTAVLSLTANDLLEPLTLLPAQDEGRGVPVYEAVVRYAKNYVVQNSDLAFGVSDARRATLAAEWREAVATTASVQTTHLLAPRLVVETLIANAADAATEATRLQTLYGTQRRVWEVVTQLNADTAAVDLGDVVELTHDRYGLSAGVLTRVLSVEPNAARSRCRFLLWG